MVENATNPKGHTRFIDHYLRKDIGSVRDILTMFDLDGTLVTMWEVHIRAYETTIREIYGVSGVNFRESNYRPGGTNEDTARSALRHFGYSDEFIEPRIKEVTPRIVEYYMNFNIGKDDVTILPGVEKLLRVLNDNGSCVCLVTGNNTEVALKILSAAGLADNISFVVGSNNNSSREGRLNSAISKAEQKRGVKYEPEKRYFFDDSDSSIPVSKKLGIRSMAVATGEIGYKDLEAAKPYRLFMDLTNTSEILRILSDRNSAKVRSIT